MKILRAYAALILAAGAPSAWGQAQPAQAPLQRVRLVAFMVDEDSSLLPYLVARDKGFFRDNGLSVEISFGLAPSQPGASREADIGQGDVYQMSSNDVYQIEAKKPGSLKVFSLDYQDAALGNDALLVRRRSGISSLSDLDPDKPIDILNDGPACYLLLRQLIKKAGVAPDPFWFIYSTHAPWLAGEDADSGQGDLVYAHEPNCSMLVSDGRWEVLTEGPLFAKNILSPWFVSMSCFAPEFLVREPALAQKVLVSYRQATDFIKEHPQEARNILARDFQRMFAGAPPLALRLLHYAMSDDMDPGAVQKQSDWFLENNLSPAKIDAARLLYRVRGAVEPQP